MNPAEKKRTLPSFHFCPFDLSTETALNKVEKSSLMLAYEVNAVGPILVMKVRESKFSLFFVKKNLSLDIMPKKQSVQCCFESK